VTLTEKINQDMKDAMKSGDRVRLEALRSIRAAILEFEKRGTGREMNEDEERTLLSQAAKRRREAIEQYHNAGRQDLEDQERRELDVISQYLPEQMGEAEIKSALEEIIRTTGAASMQDIGKVMGQAMKALKGKADGTLVQSIARSLLGG
jgi:uncharacterized protein YqeY